jgi:hypothetical protein
MKSHPIMVALAAVTLSSSVLVPAGSVGSTSENHKHYIVTETAAGRHVVRRVSDQEAVSLRSNGVVVGQDVEFSVLETSEANGTLTASEPPVSEPPTTEPPTTEPPVSEPPTTEPPTTNPPTPVIARRGNVVAVIDSGVQTSNPRLAASLLPGANFAQGSHSETEPWLDGEGHGTAVAGVVLTHNPAALILPVRVMGNSGEGSTYNVVQGIYWAVEHGAGVINLSVGALRVSLKQDPMVAEALQTAVERGVVVVASAGNQGGIGSPLSIPAAFDQTISVGSIRKNNTVSGFSSRRQDVDITAIGEDVKVLSLKGGYTTESGTSFSAPIVAAAASQLLTAHPEWGVTEVRNQLLATAKDLGPKGPDAAYGFGALDVKKALTKSLSAPVGAVPAPKPFTKLKVQHVQGGVVLSAKGSSKPLFVSQDGVESKAVSPLNSYYRVETSGEFRVWTYDKYGIPTQAVVRTFTSSDAPAMKAVAYRKGNHTYVKVLTKLPKGLRVAVTAPVKASSAVLYSTTNNNRSFEAFSERVPKVTACFETGSLETFGCTDIDVQRR